MDLKCVLEEESGLLKFEDFRQVDRERIEGLG